MSDDCITGALNTQAIKDLKEANLLLFQKIEEDGKIKRDIFCALTEIKTIQAQEKQHRINIDKEFSQHIKESVNRIKDVESNTAFRKVGIWIVGLIFTVVGWFTKCLFAKGG